MSFNSSGEARSNIHMYIASREKVQLERTAKVRVRWHSAVRPDPLLFALVKNSQNTQI